MSLEKLVARCVAKDETSALYSVRALEERDVDIFKAIRIQALTQHPGVFLDTVEKARNRHNDDWAKLITGPNKRAFGLFHKGRAIGIGSVFQPNTSIPTVHLSMGYVAAAHQGQGLSSLLYEARIAWAREHAGFTKITASHRAGNVSSRNAMTRFGFTYTHEEDEHFGDGVTDKSWKYELPL